MAIEPGTMNKVEAKRIIQAELEKFRAKPYAELAKLIGAGPITRERTGATGKWYQIEIEAFWDAGPGGDIRVLGSIDDGGLRAFSPLTDDFIKSPSDEFVGE
ncbi:MAG: hypothetical protein PVH18_09745 [Chloroflexota bacterium]|jgi:hypothetical protein